MSKNYATLYASTNDSIALEQRWYLKEETTKGTLIGPTNTDFLFTLTGGSVEYTQPFESSPHRSGRHNNSIIKKKKTCSWSFSTYFNIDETQGAASSTEIDAPVRELFKSLMGVETTSPNLKYDVSSPSDKTFSIHCVGDKFSQQARGGFVQGGDMSFPGDGEAMCAWTGAAVEALLVGIGKSIVDNDTLNTVTLGTGEGKRFPVGSLVMIIKSNGTTRSADTASGVYRKVTAVSGDVVTVDGAVLADADGTSTPVYLVYAEPPTPAAVNNPVTGLYGQAAFTGTTLSCFRSFGVNIQNNHELVDYCWGHDSLDAPFFIPGSRVTATVKAELNMNERLVEFFNSIQAFDSQAMTIRLGTATGRRLEVALPKIQFPPPSFSVPDAGSIPVTFEGTAYQTAFDAADEVTIEFK